MLLAKEGINEDGQKDAVLNQLATRYNVAQFVSFGPDLTQRFVRIRGIGSSEFSSLEEACGTLLRSSDSGAINIRSFKPGSSKGHKLASSIRSSGEAASVIRRRADAGFFTIANELIPLDDGGVSGVAVGGIVEFAPGDTPKCVDEPGVASLPRSQGLRLLEIAYGFRPEIEFGGELRVEFSLHPIRRGLLHQHTIIWELERTPTVRDAVLGKWPNRFSKHIGDKAYGLLIANLLGMRVPRTIVVGRNVAPFAFGETTGTREYWIRTCPRMPIAGKYPTRFGWEDPFALMMQCDPAGDVLSSVLAQESVDFVFSGATLSTEHGPLIEGRSGRGDAFMVGDAASVPLPGVVMQRVAEIHNALIEPLRSVKFEWVWDREHIWIVQLHRRPRGISRSVIYSGDVERYITFDRASGLESLRSLISTIQGQNVGVIVSGDVGVTSHFGDLLREAKIPSRVEWEDAHDPAQLSLIS